MTLVTLVTRNRTLEKVSKARKTRRKKELF